MRGIFFFLILETLLWLASPAARAFELPEFYRGSRAMAMGNAFTAISDDADAVFYNPAGLALNSRYQFRLLNPKIEASQDDLTVVGDLKGAASGLDAATIGRLFGKHVYGDASIYPSLYFPGFEIGYFARGQVHMVSRNTAMPAIEATYYRDQGVVGGFGFEAKGLMKKHFLRMGFTVKWMRREGFNRIIPLTELIRADADTFSRLVTGPSMGWGGGFGLQYEMGFGRSDDLILGAAWQDIGNITFGNALSTSPPPQVENNLAAGAAFVHRFGTSIHSENNLKISAELRHLARKHLDPRLQMHFGAEIDLGFLSIQGGYNQDSLTAGASIDIWLLRLSAVTYGVETQSLAFLDRERRYGIEVTFKFDMQGKQARTERDAERKKRPRTY